MAGLSFDSGVLIALDRNDTRAWAWLRRAVERGEPPLVSAVAVAECWRDGRRQAQLARALDVCEVRDVDQPLARSAGLAQAAVPGSGTVDALVAALAAGVGALLVTDDPEDMRALAESHFRSLRIATLRRA